MSLQRLCTHFMHKVHFIELASTPLPQTPQGYFLESTTFWRPTPHFMTFVFPTFTLNPFASNPLFHLCSFLFKSSSESANSTKSSAYNNSQGNPLSSNLLDSASITMIKSSGLSTDPWWTPTSTGKGSNVSNVNLSESLLLLLHLLFRYARWTGFRSLVCHGWSAAWQNKIQIKFPVHC